MHIFNLSLTDRMFQPMVIPGPGNGKYLAHLRNTESFGVLPDKPIAVYGFFVKSSRPRDFHPQPLTEPDVSLSAHPALVIRSLALFQLSSVQIDYWNVSLFFANT